MSSADPEERAGRAGVLAVLGLLVAVVLLHAPRYLAGHEPVGDDASSHVLASYRAAEYLRSGSTGWWMSDLELGFPLAHFYQPLPHVATGALALALGGPEHAAQAYKLLVVALLAALPLTSYFGLRRAGLGRVGALCASVALVSLSTTKDYFGLTTRHFLLLGLYTMLWGAVFVPLALGEGLRFLQGRGRAAAATTAFALLFLSHGLLALGLVPVFVCATLLGPASDGLRARALRLCTFGVLTGLVIAFWLLPQLTCSDYFAGWSIADPERANGLGLGATLAGWLSGRLTDLRRVPAVAWLSLLGCAVAAARWRRPESRVVLFGVALFLAFTAGRRTFGSLVDWVYPVNARIEGMLRWMAMLQLFLAIAAGLGAEWLGGRLVALAQRAPRPARRVAPVLVPGVLLACTLPGHLDDLGWGLDTFLESHDRASFVAVAERLRTEPDVGRVYAADPVGQISHWVMAYLGLLAHKPMTISYGVGVQDSLNFHYLWQFGGKVEQPLVLAPKRAAGLLALFNVRYLVRRPDVRLDHLQTDALLVRGPYELLRLHGDYGYFDVVPPPVLVPEVPPVLLRARFERWLSLEYPRGARFLRLPEPVHARLPVLPSATLSSLDEQVGSEAVALPTGAERVGTVLSEEAGTNRYRARVAVTGAEGWALLKVTPHPWWHAQVDGIETPVYHFSPAFQGVPLGPGEHEVTFTFRNPPWQLALLGAAPLILAGLWTGPWLRARRRNAVRS